MKIIEHPACDIPRREYFDNRSQEFIIIEAEHREAFTLKLEHSLMSIAKWEGRWKKPFLDDKELTGEELLDYIRCMTINTVKNPKVYDWLANEDLLEILNYMRDSNSAWEIRKDQKKPKKKTKPKPVEHIYFAMVQYGIPLDCEQWHFNRLMALIDYFDNQGGGTPGAGGQKKRSEREIMDMYRALNEKNRKKYNSKG